MQELGQELIAVLGEAAIVPFAERFGGTRLYVPFKLDDEHEVTQAIGREAADALCKRFAPSTIRIPLFRDQRIMALHAKGASAAQIATRFAMTENGVVKALKRIREADQMVRPDCI